MGAEALDEVEDGGRVAESDLVHVAGDGVLEGDLVGGEGLSLGHGGDLAVAGDPDEDVAVVPAHVARVDPQIPGQHRLGPGAGERLPRPLQPLHREVPEVRLQQLLHVLAELHVEVPVERRRRVVAFLRALFGGDISEDVGGGLTEDPGAVGVISRDDPHADSHVAEAGEDVDGAAHVELREGPRDGTG